jgi:hypothetical protein
MHLNTRPAKVGNQIPSRSEMHGDESVTALDIPLTDIMLDEAELAELLRQPKAAAALFDDSGGMRKPFFAHIKPLALDEKIEGATVTLTHGVAQDTLRLTNVKLAKIKLQPCVGGMTAMDVTVQCTPELNDAVAHLLGWLNATVDVEIDGGEFGKQGELPIDAAPEPTDDADVVRWPGRRVQ